MQRGGSDVLFAEFVERSSGPDHARAIWRSAEEVTQRRPLSSGRIFVSTVPGLGSQAGSSCRETHLFDYARRDGFAALGHPTNLLFHVPAGTAAAW